MMTEEKMEDKVINNLDDEKSRTLYVRWPKTIRDDKEVMNLFSNDIKVKLPRQKSRCCHIVFPTIKKRENCLETMKDKLNVDGKKIVLMPLMTKSLDRRKNKITRKVEVQKKVVIPRPQFQSSVQSLYVTNIPNETKVQEVKDAFPESATLALLKPREGKKRSAIIKMSRVELGTAYLNNENPAPIIHGNKVKIFPYKKKSKSLKKKLTTMLKKIEKTNQVKDESDDDNDS
ncbi:uncharacterized protein LOC122504040 isoform X2 [Leptopilina heterotoma]|uniref:uncharacterized protein LOC122504040 isoform X2 n=1 Tax=Leptopilina heterotoma TaxID=63436 RepID=UPI001CA96E55|nr:uncharacterized protein LOC122504040 isoform X2 [Leptopilina heterotoma]